MNRLALTALLLCAVACSAARTPVHASFPTQAPPRWTYAFPDGGVYAVRIAHGIVLVSQQTGITALDAKSGKLRWRRALNGYMSFIDERRVYANDGEDTMVALDISSGSSVWRNANVCPRARYAKAPFALYSDNASVYVACAPAIARVRSADGKVLASATPLAVSGFNNLQPAGSGALALNGFSDGAEMSLHLALLRPDSLSPIGETMEDTSFLGVERGRAIVDDGCCMGRPNVYDPATIYAVSLTTGTASPHVDLSPDPQLFPADKRPIGQGAAAAIIGDHLYLAVMPMLYDYGDPLSLASTPKRLLANLTQVPVFMGDFLFAQTARQDGSVVDELVDLRGGRMAVRWKQAEHFVAMPYFEPSSPAITSVTDFNRGGRNYTQMVRLRDGATINVGPCGRPFASDGRHVAVICRDAPPRVQETLLMFTLP